MVVMPAKVQKDVCNQEDIGQQKYTNFVEERINTNEVSILARMKVQQKTWKSARKLKVDTERAIETFVCQLYEPGSTVVDVGDLRWKLFTKKQLEAQKLPQTRGALHEAIAGHITRPWCGVRITFLTLSYHQQQPTGGRKRGIG